MRYGMQRALMMLAFVGVVSSCASKVSIQPVLPSVQDVKYEAEPAYPVAALDPCPAGTDDQTCPAVLALAKWHDEVLVWGRKGWAQNARVCRWSVDLGLKVPDGYCGPLLPK